MYRFKFLIVAAMSLISIPTIAKSETLVVAAGCFWCIQPPYDALKSQGVLQTRVGYTGGNKANPSYEEVSAGNTGHIEAIEVTYDSQKISRKKLLEVFLLNIDPYDEKGQFCDKGPQYISAFFYKDEADKNLFEDFKKEWIARKKLKPSIITKSLPLSQFYPAEGYHQSYYQKNPVRYKYYRYRCGRDQRLKEIWRNQ